MGGESWSLEALVFVLNSKGKLFLPRFPVSQTSTRLKQHKDQAFRTPEDLRLLYSSCQKSSLAMGAVV